MAEEHQEWTPISVKRLQEIITFPSGGFMMEPSDDYNEVLPNVLLGDKATALDVHLLRRLKITHVLNAAVGTTQYHVQSNEEIYTKAKMKYLGIEATDFINFDLRPFYEEAANFIECALKSGGSVLVHCRQGMSRSAALVLAYMMIKQRIPLEKAVRIVRKEREILPNEGFLQQLIDYEIMLRKKGHFLIQDKN